MQPERIPTDNPPSPRLTLVTADGDAHSIQARKRRSNRILAWSVLASLGVNALGVVLLGHADLFGQAGAFEAVKRIRVQVYRPPVRKPPKPQSAGPPPMPPARTPRVRRIAARSSPLQRPRLPAPPPEPPRRLRPTPQTPAPRPAMPAAPHISPPTLVQHTTRTASARSLPTAQTQLLPGSTIPSSGLPPAPRNSAPSAATIPSAPSIATTPRQDNPSAPPAKHDAPPQVKHDDSPPPQVKHDDSPPPQVKHEEPKRPANWMGVEVQAAAVNSVPAPDTSGVDPDDVKGPCVVSFEIGENGRVSNVRIRKSSGSSDFDRACQDAIRRARCVPAIQDHIPQVQKMIYSFSS